MTGKRKNTVADNPLVRSRVAVVWSDLITQGRIQGAKTVADAYNARFEDKEPSSTINDRTARKVIIDLLKTGEIEIRYKRFGLEPEINENLSVILERIWPEAVKKFVVVDIPAMTRMKTADTYRALNEVSYPHIKAALKSYISNPDSNRTVGWGSGYTAFHLADLVSQDPEMKSILSNAEIYPLTASIYRPEIHAKLLTEGAMAAQHLPGAPEVFDAQYNAQVIQKFSGCIVEDVPGPIFNMDRDKKNSADCENWIQSAEFALKSVKKKYGYDEEVIQTTLQNSTSEFNIVGAGAFSKNHKIFDIIRGFGLNEDTYPIPSEILSKLNRLADITEEIKRLTKNDFDEELDVCYDICNRFYVINLPDRFKKNPLLQMMVNDARALVDGGIIPNLDTVRKTVLRFSGKSNNMITNGKNRAYLVHDLLERGVVRFNMICIDSALAEKMIALARPSGQHNK